MSVSLTSVFVVTADQVLLPIIRDFPTNSAYVKTLLIGLAFACNLGGMMTPISSLQNTLAVSYLEKAGYSISFGQWMALAVPFCTVSTVLVSPAFATFAALIVGQASDNSLRCVVQCWLFLLWVFDPKDAKYIPQIVYDQKQKISSLHVTVIALTLLTIFLWATFSITSPTFGDLGIISLMFMVRRALACRTLALLVLTRSLLLSVSLPVCDVRHGDAQPVRLQLVFVAHSVPDRRRQRLGRC